MPIRKTLLASGAALLLSAGIAAAAPATVQTDLNVRSGPGTQYQVIGTIPSGETVEAGACSGSWCQVSFSGGSGYASSNYLAIGGGAPSAAVVAPSYAYDPGYAYDDDYYNSGYSYGPSIGFYAGPRFYNGRRWHGRPGGWAGRPGWNSPRTGNWQGRSGGPRVGNIGGGPRSFGAAGGGPRISAPAGMRTGGAGGGARAAGGR